MVSFTNYLWVIFISMLPVIELRGAIPVAAGFGINPAVAYIICVLGNMLPIPFILLFIKHIFALLKKVPLFGKLVDKLENNAFKKMEKVDKYSFWGLAIFVAIPLPGTGAWTGALIAALLDMKIKKSLPAIFLGVVIAGAAVTLITTGAIAGAGVLKDIFFIH
ncbi:MAG: small multi-drug export protein [Clostridiales bacterium]|jgi:uncharacterized membrane protein|nr:small multi-drug export protein [Clostridiales bacterium]